MAISIPGYNPVIQLQKLEKRHARTRAKQRESDLAVALAKQKRHDQEDQALADLNAATAQPTASAGPILAPNEASLFS